MPPWLKHVTDKIALALGREDDIELLYGGTPSSFARQVLERARHESSGLAEGEQFDVQVTLPSNLDRDQIMLAVAIHSYDYGLEFDSCFDGKFSFAKEPPTSSPH